MRALRATVLVLGVCNQLAVVLLELLAMAVVFVYLLDKGWGIFFAAIITLSIIGSIITTIYAALADGYWAPALISVSGIVVAVAGGLVLGGLESLVERGEAKQAARQRYAHDWREDYPPNWDELRREVYSRYNYTCANCGETDVRLHAHHVIPLSQGGTNNPSNLIALCEDCHLSLHPHMRD